MALGIDPKIDFACKKLLGSPEHPAITLHFINAVLGGNPLITQVEILNPIVGREFEEDKLSVLDVLARDSQGRRFNIEVQTSRPAESPERLTYYIATQLVGQIGEGEGYRNLRPAIGICILDAIMFNGIPGIHHDFRLRNAATGLILTDRLQIHLLELPKYSPPCDNQVVTEPIERWAYFFRRAHESTSAELADRLGGGVFSEAIGVLEMIARTPRERDFYEARLKMQRDEQARLEFAEARGEARGEAIGKIQMLQKFLEIDVSSANKLRQLTLEQLSTLVADLELRLRERE